MLTTVSSARPVVRLKPRKLLPVRLQHYPHLFGSHLTTVVQGIKGFGKRLLAVGTVVPLTAFTRQDELISFHLTAKGAFHSCR